MLIDSVHDLLNALEKISNREDIGQLVADINELPVLATTNRELLDCDDEDIRGLVETLEMCCSYYLFFESGIVNKASESLLKKHNYVISKLDNEEYGFDYAVGNPKFNILFSL